MEIQTVDPTFDDRLNDIMSNVERDLKFTEALDTINNFNELAPDYKHLAFEEIHEYLTIDRPDQLNELIELELELIHGVDTSATRIENAILRIQSCDESALAQIEKHDL